MGSVHQAHCRCGFEEEVSVGGSRSPFLEESDFPFYCDECGLVSVNVALLPPEQVVTRCPVCEKWGCTQYGIPPVSLYDLRPVPWWKKLFVLFITRNRSAALRWDDRKASEDGHKCPRCHEMQLRFSRFPSLMFD